ncbi:CoA transferase [Streptomyces sp. NPDC002143]
MAGRTRRPRHLKGLRVLDLSCVLAGPFCDHGADVIKVEGPAGDETRSWGPPFHPDGTSAYFHGLNRNKHNLSLDLSTPAGREVVARLLSEADVVIKCPGPGQPVGPDADGLSGTRFRPLLAVSWNTRPEAGTRDGLDTVCLLPQMCGWRTSSVALDALVDETLAG